MECKLHVYDQSSTIGVCASCLRYRLLFLHHHSLSPSDDSNHHHLHVNPLFAPRPAEHHNNLAASTSSKRKQTSISLFSNFFRSRSEKLDSNRKLNQNQSGSIQIDTQPFSSSSSSWFSMFSSGRRKGSDGDLNGGVSRKPCRKLDRGMSPVRPEYDDCNRSPSGNCSPKWKNTPVETSAVARRRKSKSVSGLTFCLSPLVRASPNLPSDGGYAGDFKKKTPSSEVAFCKNRSRKLVDFGRGNSKR